MSDKKEQNIVKTMTTAVAIADSVFGANADTEAAHEIFDWLEVAPSVEEFTADLKRVYAYAANVHKAAAPTSEQVFGLFERIFDFPK